MGRAFFECVHVPTAIPVPAEPAALAGAAASAASVAALDPLLSRFLFGASRLYVWDGGGCAAAVLPLCSILLICCTVLCD
jgi:hypothetical protein